MLMVSRAWSLVKVVDVLPGFAVGGFGACAASCYHAPCLRLFRARWSSSRIS